MSAYMPKAESVEWGTPKAFFDKLDAEFHFTLDVCASDWNHKCPIWFSEQQDGLKQLWRGVVWCNPPYGHRNIALWLDKAILERHRGVTTVMLLPNTTDVQWFHKWVWDESKNTTRFGIELRFVKGRIQFDYRPGYVPPPGKKKTGNVKGSIIVIIRPV